MDIIELYNKKSYSCRRICPVYFEAFLEGFYSFCYNVMIHGNNNKYIWILLNYIIKCRRICPFFSKKSDTLLFTFIVFYSIDYF